MELIVENVRSFAGSHRIPLRPVTILTGENSSGKSTLLSVVSAVFDPKSYPFSPAFNEPPYNLGSYDTIATYKGGKYGRAKTFAIGFSGIESAEGTVGSHATYRSVDGQVAISALRLSVGDNNFNVDFHEGTRRQYAGEVSIQAGGKEYTTGFNLPEELQRSLPTLSDLVMGVYQSVDHPRDRARMEREIFYTVFSMSRHATPLRARSVAPIRTKPERIYGQISEAYQPGGDHIPFILERIFREKTSARDRRAVTSALDRFGRESGMFKKVAVKRLGNRPTDPFQLMITVAGRPANLVDVGYGISQSLPVVIESALASAGQILLLQQPEVHLHPRAQAALGTFFSDLVGTGATFVLETHSDYIIDRIRQEVATGKINPDQVALLFCHKPGLETRVHHLDLDDAGNLVNAPRAYRDFFLAEELRLLSRVGAR